MGTLAPETEYDPLFPLSGIGDGRDKELALASAAAAMAASGLDLGMPTRDDLCLSLSFRANKASLSRASLALFFAKVASLTLRSASTFATAAALVIEAAAILAAARSALAASLSITLVFVVLLLSSSPSWVDPGG